MRARYAVWTASLRHGTKPRRQSLPARVAPDFAMDAPSPAGATAAQPASLTHPEILRIIAGVLMAMFLAALDQTIIATALPTVGRELGDFDLLPWVVTSYLLTATAVTPLYGKLSDIR